MWVPRFRRCQFHMAITFQVSWGWRPGIDKNVGASLMSFMEIGFATIAVIILGYLPMTIFSSFLLVVGLALFIVAGCCHRILDR